jgi:hypothetical protein
LAFNVNFKDQSQGSCSIFWAPPVDNCWYWVGGAKYLQNWGLHSRQIHWGRGKVSHVSLTLFSKA